MATEQRSEYRDRVQYLSGALSPSDISIVPYARVGEVWTLKDDVLLDFGRQMQAERKFERVFYDGRIRTPHDMLEILQQPANLPVFAFMGDRIIGLAWLNGLCGNRAFAHFCMLDSAHGKPALKACRMFLDYWLSFEDAGEPVIEFIIGVIQDRNERAVKFVEALGFKRLGVIPNMLEDAYTGDRASAVVSYFSRFEDTHGRRWQ